MKESIKIMVVVDEEGNDTELEIILADDVMDFIIDGKRLFSVDWPNNFKDAAERMLKIWSA